MDLEGLLHCLQGGSLGKHQGCSSCGWSVEVKQGLEVHIHRTQEQVILQVHPLAYSKPHYFKTELVTRGMKQVELEAKRQAEEVQGVKNKVGQDKVQI